MCRIFESGPGGNSPERRQTGVGIDEGTSRFLRISINFTHACSEITKDDAGKIVSLGDDLKAAATDALKKCATLFGVGLHLYEERRNSETRL